jgi:hypothetical protein
VAWLILFQSHLVVASGASNTNSLRIIRSGVGLEEVVLVEGISDVTGIWSLSDPKYVTQKDYRVVR